MRIFVSSTFADLKDYRQVARDVIVSLGHEAEMVGALSGLSDEQVADACAAKAHRCDACVLTLGFRLGSEPPDLKAVERAIAAYGVGSFTSVELKVAQAAGLPILAYLLRESSLARAVRAEEAAEGWIPVRRREERVSRFRGAVAGDHIVRLLEPRLDEFRATLTVDLMRLAESQTRV